MALWAAAHSSSEAAGLADEMYADAFEPQLQAEGLKKSNKFERLFSA
jgi:hypothetical protein